MSKGSSTASIPGEEVGEQARGDAKGQGTHGYTD